MKFLLAIWIFGLSLFVKGEDNVQQRIIGGQEARLGQFPWQAAVFFQTSESSSFWFCSGSIISSQWILTTAHCVKDASSALVYTGITDLSSTVDPTSFPTEFILHDEYDSSTFAHDIGLIKLPEALVFDDKTQAIDLSLSLVADNTEVYISGWGKSNRTDTNINTNLIYINLKTISNSECQKAHGIDISDDLFCAVSDATNIRKGLCDGDGGDPVIIQISENKAELVGIVSFIGEADCGNKTPSGLTKISSYRDWIKSKTGV